MQKQKNVFNEKLERIAATDLEMQMAMFDERVEACKDCKTYLFCKKHQDEWVKIRYQK